MPSPAKDASVDPNSSCTPEIVTRRTIVAIVVSKKHDATLDLERAVYESIRAVRREVAWTSRRRTYHAPETLQVLGEQHMTLNDAIARRDTLGAAAAMEQHLLTVSKTLLRDRVRKIELDL